MHLHIKNNCPLIYRCACLDWEYDEWKIIGGYNQLYWSLTVSLGNIWQEIGKVEEGRYYDDSNYSYARHMSHEVTSVSFSDRHI